MDSDVLTSSGSGGGGVKGANSAATKPGVGSRSVMVPQLDEEVLSTSRNVGLMMSDGMGGGEGGGEMMGNGGQVMMYDLVSPQQENAAYTLALLQQQQQQQQAVAAAAAQLEHDYLQTRDMLHRCPRNVLLAVLTALLDEYPTTMVGLVRMRLDQLLAARPINALSPTATSTSAARTPNTRRSSNAFVPNSAAAPWSPSSQTAHGLVSGNGAATGAGTPYATAASSSPSHRKGSRGHKTKEEDQEMCSVHHNMRALKHLQLNPETGLYECVHGFHCLVDGPVNTATTPAASSSPAAGSGQEKPSLVSSSGSSSNVGITAPVIAHHGAAPGSGVKQPFVERDQSGRSDSAPGPVYAVNHGFNTMPESSEGGFNGGTADDDMNVDINTLQNLLQSLRDMEESET